MQRIAPEYANDRITFEPGERLHRLVALLCDTNYDDLTDARIADLEASVESWRWMNAAGERVDQ
jgi:hypothetical protein